VTSADSDMKTVEKGVKHGARDYLVKPVRIEILRNIWQHVIRKTVYNTKLDAVEAKTLRNSLPRKRHQRDEDESGQSSEESLAQKKSRVVWKTWLHEKFIAAVQQLGVDSKHVVYIDISMHAMKFSILSFIKVLRYPSIAFNSMGK
jgi:two-component response regulator ARR-B family